MAWTGLTVFLCGLFVADVIPLLIPFSQPLRHDHIATWVDSKSILFPYVFIRPATREVLVRAGWLLRKTWKLVGGVRANWLLREARRSVGGKGAAASGIGAPRTQLAGSCLGKVFERLR